MVVGQSLSVAAATVDGVRVWRAPDHTRLVFDLSEAVTHKVFPLTNPDRLVIDIDDVSLKADTSTLDFSSSPIASIRSAVQEQENLRIVLDLTKAVQPRSFPLAKNEQYGDRLVVDLYDRGKETAKTVADVTAENNHRNIIVAIDAGHGGEDPGALGPKRIREKQVVLAISRELKKMFDRTPGYTAILVRDGDYYIPLRQRTDIAHQKRADMFISIHADAFNKSSAHGASVFALSRRGATSEAARYLASRENRADLIGGAGSVSLDDKDHMLASVLLDLSMTATLSSSLDVGAEVLKSIGGVARLHKKKVEQAGFVVLKSPDIPSILIETGFISNPTEAKRLASRDYQQKMARAIYQGVSRYFSTNLPVGTLLAANKAGVDASGHHSPNTYVIARGDTLSDIAVRYNITVKELLHHNGLSSTRIWVGQRLKIPTI
ncbi:MAG: N-acetylmuramoyl-L-alanine amidase [Porticoccus sp.]|nr:N-acetylmuramoyl-L-alanine amidase [Porticoccus sp.]